MCRRFTYLAFLAMFTMAPAVGAEPESVIWPLDLPTRYLTSNFMEYRPGRFHAGLDLKTQTVSGFAARAVEDGWVVRVRATPNAYGRAVYLRGKSGRTYVYAHLSRFSDQLRALVNQQRSATGTYRARLQFKAAAVPVKQGDVLGLTGESGTGGPHLHFEVRDVQNRPTEPQVLGFSVGDTIAPVIHHLRAWPVTAETTIEGAPREHILDLDRGLSGQQPPLHVNGPVAFSARIIDRSDIRDHRLESSLLTVHLDGELVYQCRNEHYDFAENALQRLEWVVLPGVREHWLHRHSANTLVGRQGGLWYLGSAGEGLDQGRHEVRIAAADRAGNQTDTTFELVVNTGPLTPPAKNAGAWRAADARLTMVSADSLSHIAITPFFDVNSQSSLDDASDLRRREYLPANGDPVMAPLVVYSRTIGLAEDQREAAADQGLRPLGTAREFLAATWPIEASLPVDMKDPVGKTGQDRTAWGLYRWDRDAWDLVDQWPATPSKDGNVVVHLDQTGLHAVMVDHSPPVIGRPTEPVVLNPGPTSRIEGVTLPYWEVVPIALHDLGSGVASESIKVLLDGQALIVEPDLPRDRILIEFPAGMSPGGHRLNIEVADRTGQRATRALEIQVRE